MKYTKTSDFDYELPKELIAQTPLSDRTQSRMLVVHKNTGEHMKTDIFTILSNTSNPVTYLSETIHV